MNNNECEGHRNSHLGIVSNSTASLSTNSVAIDYFTALAGLKQLRELIRQTVQDKSKKQTLFQIISPSNGHTLDKILLQHVEHLTAGEINAKKEAIEEALNAGMEAYMDYVIQLTERVEAAGIDPLTGLIRKEFAFPTFKELYLSTALKVAETETPLYVNVIDIDLDNFKKGNTTYGEPQMDRVLSQVGKTILSTVRKPDKAVHLGGDAFHVYAVSSSSEGALKLSELLKERISQQHHPLKRQGTIEFYTATASIGYTYLMIDAKTAHRIKQLYNQYGILINNATNGKRGMLIKERDEKLDEIVNEFYKGAVSASNDARYEAKLLKMKNSAIGFEPVKKENGFYQCIREIYTQYVSGHLTLKRASQLAQECLKTMKQAP
jgi:diguanylate cyclase (GGDEF)-like protein